MAQYFYKALMSSGLPTSGELTADSREEAAQLLNGRGLLVKSISPKHRFLWGRAQRGGIGLEEFLLFNQELIALLGAGLTIPETLELLSQRKGQDAFQSALTEVRRCVNNGLALSDACSIYPEVFDPVFIANLQVGERIGDIVGPLKRYQANMRVKLRLRRKLIQALIYPAFLLGSMGIILVVLFLFALPRFVEMYSGFDAQLPLATRFLIQLTDSSPTIILTAMLLAVFSWMGLRFYRYRSRTAAINIARIQLHIPIIGVLKQRYLLARICRTLGNLLKSGLPLSQSLQVTSKAIGNKHYANILEMVVAEVDNGESFSRSLQRKLIFESGPMKIIEAGERSGTLSDMLESVAAFYEGQAEYRIDRAMSALEPALMLLIGVLVGGVLLAMYLPIFSMTEVIR